MKTRPDERRKGSGLRVLMLAALVLGVRSLPAQAGGNWIVNDVIVSNKFEQKEGAATNYFMGSLGVGTELPMDRLHVNGDARIDGRIKGLSDPMESKDAATKAYVDAMIANGELKRNGDFSEGKSFWLDDDPGGPYYSVVNGQAVGALTYLGFAPLRSVERAAEGQTYQATFEVVSLSPNASVRVDVGGHVFENLGVGVHTVTATSRWDGADLIVLYFGNYFDGSLRTAAFDNVSVRAIGSPANSLQRVVNQGNWAWGNDRMLELITGTEALWAGDMTKTVKLVDDMYAVNASGGINADGSYFNQGIEGQTIDNSGTKIFAGGIMVAPTTGFEDYIKELAPSLVTNGSMTVTNLTVERIYDANGVLRIEFSGILYDAGGVPSVDFNNRQLSLGVFPTVDWSMFQLRDDVGVSVQWYDRELKDNGGGTAMDWGDRKLYDNGGADAVEWGPASRKLHGEWKIQQQGNLSMGSFTAGGF